MAKVLFLLENSMKVCEIIGCGRRYEAKGFCKSHYIRFKKYGNPFYTEIGRTLEKHGMYGTPEYNTWYAMKARCYNKNNNRYKYYGGRGIIVCERWRNSFMTFLKDMGLKPFAKAQIDRIDNDGNYELSNCHWTTCAENVRHRSTTKLTMHKIHEIRIKHKTGEASYRRLATIYGVDFTTIADIIKHKTWR